ncbi:unnamed protein product, partial [Closterium sp. Naga37s-1]
SPHTIPSYPHPSLLLWLIPPPPPPHSHLLFHFPHPPSSCPPPVAPELPVHNDDPECWARILRDYTRDHAAYVLDQATWNASFAAHEAARFADIDYQALRAKHAHHLLYSPTPSPPPSGFYPPPPAPPGSPPVCTPDCPASGH